MVTEEDDVSSTSRCKDAEELTVISDVKTITDDAGVVVDVADASAAAKKKKKKKKKKKTGMLEKLSFLKHCCCF